MVEASVHELIALSSRFPSMVTVSEKGKSNPRGIERAGEHEMPILPISASLILRTASKDGLPVDMTCSEWSSSS